MFMYTNLRANTYFVFSNVFVFYSYCILYSVELLFVKDTSRSTSRGIGQ